VSDHPKQKVCATCLVPLDYLEELDHAAGERSGGRYVHVSRVLEIQNPLASGSMNPDVPDSGKLESGSRRERSARLCATWTRMEAASTFSPFSRTWLSTAAEATREASRRVLGTAAKRLTLTLLSRYPQTVESQTKFGPGDRGLAESGESSNGLPSCRECVGTRPEQDDRCGAALQHDVCNLLDTSVAASHGLGPNPRPGFRLRDSFTLGVLGDLLVRARSA